MIVIVLLIQCIAVLLESLATSFWTLFVGTMMAQVATTYIVFAAIAWLLPSRDATSYTSYFVAFFMTSYLLGPAVAGIVAYYSTYSMFCHLAIFIVTP